MALAVASSLSRLIIFGVCIAALPIIKKRADAETRARAYKLKGGYRIPVVALGLCVWMASYSSAESWRFVAYLLAVGLLLFGIEQMAVRKADTR